MENRTIKCPNCGTFNKNRDYCKVCNTLISHKKKRELKEAKVKQAQIDEVIHELENPNLAERLKKHPNIFYKIIGWVLYSAITIVSLIGAGLAWFIAMVAAG
ncbi:hypothetical protein [Polaribacter sp. Asnod1-A03]|uniref:hypothetical protein n=1 Tax=Polaribacter sp. Asnod1-A03 TaxID=3160581 RepID=UPI00386CD1D0